MTDIEQARQWVLENPSKFADEADIQELLTTIFDDLEYKQDPKSDVTTEWEPISAEDFAEAERELILNKELSLNRGSNHYKQGTIEPIEIIGLMGNLTTFCVCNIIKYTLRASSHKNPLDSLAKVSVYNDWIKQVYQKVFEIKERKSGTEV